MAFDKKRILVAGASSGIGKAVAMRLDELGADVVLLARNEDKLVKTFRQMKNSSQYICYDLEDTEHLEDIMSNMTLNGKLDAYVHCAGICDLKPAKQVTPFDLNKTMSINAFSFFELSRLFCKPKYSNSSAAIVGVSSFAAVTAEPGMSVYAMSKAVMNTQIKVMSKEFVKRRIRINTIMPAQVESKMGENDAPWTVEELDEVKQYQPFGAIPIEQVVNCIEFLLSNEKSGYITGESIAITGGYRSNY